MSSYRDERSPRRDGYNSPPRHRRIEDRGRPHAGRRFGGAAPELRDRPEPSHVLGVFGMSYHTKEADLEYLFGKYGDVSRVQLVRDRMTGDSRGFGFVYFKNIKQATRAKEHFEGKQIDGMTVRVDYSITPDGGPDRHKGFRSPKRPRNRSGSYSRSRSRSRSRTRSPPKHTRRRSPDRRSRSRSPVQSRHRSRRNESRSRSR